MSRSCDCGRLIAAKVSFTFWAVVTASGCGDVAGSDFPVPAISWDPQRYVCYRVAEPLTIDGSPQEASWQEAAWTRDFQDIVGDSQPPPRFRTRVKMLWDREYFYIAAVMEEPDLWATLTLRDAVIYHENDFELFIDPDGDNHLYYELEINALGTIWDLLLIKPYRDGGPAVNAWDILGLQSAVNLDGSLNDPGNRDRGWSVEIAIPWQVLQECARRDAPPIDGDIWHVNFSRVEWQLTVENGAYVKRQDPTTMQPLPEDNWVWSPQGLIAMHYPEMWGLVMFRDLPPATAETAAVGFALPGENARWQLIQLYYRQRQWQARHGSYAADLSLLEWPAGNLGHSCTLHATPTLFEATWQDANITFHVDQDSRLWQTVDPPAAPAAPDAEQP